MVPLRSDAGIKEHGIMIQLLDGPSIEEQPPFFSFDFQLLMDC
jgi:hypothetical protein